MGTLPSVELKQDNKLQKEVQRNAVATDITKPTTVDEQERNVDVIKSGNPSSSSPEGCISSNNLLINKDQPKPPTSPKPKVRKEELKLKEELAKNKEDKPHPQLIVKRSEDTSSMVAPLKVAERDASEKAVVKKLK